MWYMNLLKSISYELPFPTLHSDNISAVNMAKHPIFYHRTKHIDIDVHFFREQVARGLTNLKHVSRYDQVANSFTKPLYNPKFEPNRTKLFVSSIPPRV